MAGGLSARDEEHYAERGVRQGVGYLRRSEIHEIFPSCEITKRCLLTKEERKREVEG